jgi:hypothetical protein
LIDKLTYMPECIKFTNTLETTSAVIEDIGSHRENEVFYNTNMKRHLIVLFSLTQGNEMSIDEHK